MSNRRPNLWKPEESKNRDQETIEKGYAVCARSTCINHVENPGDICVQHQAEASLDRSPANVFTF